MDNASLSNNGLAMNTELFENYDDFKQRLKKVRISP